MKTVFPKYYAKFKCRADKCSDNCCIGWEIDIDEKTLEKYDSLSSELGERIRKSIVRDEGVPHFKMNGERCPFLNEHNLCDIISSIGDGGLCGICREHPRFYNELCGLTLGGVGMSCEAAAELILSERPAICGDISSLLSEESEEFECGSLIAKALFDIENILNSEKISDNERIYCAFSRMAELDGELCEAIFGEGEDECEDILSSCRSLFSEKEPEVVEAALGIIPELELMGEELKRCVDFASWESVCRLYEGSADFRGVIFSSLGYLILRYLPSSAEAGALHSMNVILASLIYLALLYSGCESFSTERESISTGCAFRDVKVCDDIVRRAVLFSKEIEYCEENIEKLDLQK